MDDQNGNNCSQADTDNDRRCDFGADYLAYIALAGPPFVFFVPFSYFTIFGNASTRGVWVFALLGGVVLLAVVTYLRIFRVTVRNGVLAHRSMLRGTRSIALREIKRARVDVRLLRTPIARPPYALFIEPLPSSSAKSFAINMKFLSRDDLRVLISILGDKLQDEKGFVRRLTKKR